MYYGPKSDKLRELRLKYEKMFGYDPDGDVEIEIANYEEYVSLLETCITEEKDIFDVLGI